MAGARPAAGWDRNTHVAIVRAALRLSPAAATRIPFGQREALERDAAEPDLTDRECLYHLSAQGEREPAREAERALERLLAGKGVERPYARAKAIGRYLHYVSDAAVAPEFFGENARAIDFLSNARFVLFRQKQPLPKTPAASLRERGREARWGLVSSSNSAAALRLAVNLVIEALLLLPPEAGESPREDDGPVVFILPRFDSGFGFASTGQESSTTSSGSLVRQHGGTEARTGREKYLLTDKPGVHVIEWTERRKGDVSLVRALLFNNDDTCASNILLKADSSASLRLTPPQPWNGMLKSLTVTVAPRSLRMVELEAPPAIPLERITGTWISGACTGVADPESNISTRRRVVVPNLGTIPEIDERIPEERVGKSP
jgi:hypothetical protein